MFNSFFSNPEQNIYIIPIDESYFKENSNEDNNSKDNSVNNLSLSEHVDESENSKRKNSQPQNSEEDKGLQQNSENKSEKDLNENKKVFLSQIFFYSTKEDQLKLNTKAQKIKINLIKEYMNKISQMK